MPSPRRISASRPRSSSASEWPWLEPRESTGPGPCSGFRLTLLACTRVPRLQAIKTDAHVNMDQLTAEFKQETKTLKKKAKRDMQKIKDNTALVQQTLLYAGQMNDDDDDDDDDL